MRRSVAALDKQLRPGQRRRPCVAATSAQEYLQALAILTRPQTEQVAADDVVGLHAERALERRRGELQGAIRRDDQDDVRGIRDERRVSRLHQFLRPPFTDPRIVASIVPWRSMMSSVTTKTTMVISATGPETSARAT